MKIFKRIAKHFKGDDGDELYFHPYWRVGEPFLSGGIQFFPVEWYRPTMQIGHYTMGGETTVREHLNNRDQAEKLVEKLNKAKDEAVLSK